MLSGGLPAISCLRIGDNAPRVSSRQESAGYRPASPPKRLPQMPNSNDKKPAVRPTFTDQEALDFHSRGKPGKLESLPTKPMATQRDLSLAYSPGVAAPGSCHRQRPRKAVSTIQRAANMVAVDLATAPRSSGLGDLGALASKPVMEGKSGAFQTLRRRRLDRS